MRVFSPFLLFIVGCCCCIVEVADFASDGLDAVERALRGYPCGDVCLGRGEARLHDVGDGSPGEPLGEGCVGACEERVPGVPPKATQRREKIVHVLAGNVVRGGRGGVGGMMDKGGR